MNKFFIIKGSINKAYPYGEYVPFSVMVVRDTEEDIKRAVEGIIMPEVDEDTQYNVLINEDIEVIEAGFFTRL